ncbi:hypothetical protein CEXT_544061 [Caerostris extrusa]|uniref:Uncharacterized protein n=1 Tax=Caerostris extrusa TaxID=172846 RepID=A0AAV4SJS6_CAEEX|nr:hypothetical protein CEXT_544061 [Caerostris extrusa]
MPFPEKPFTESVNDLSRVTWDTLFANRRGEKSARRGECRRKKREKGKKILAKYPLPASFSTTAVSREIPHLVSMISA